MTDEFKRKIFEKYKADPDSTIKKGKYEYTIAYNACCTIHTWIIRRKRGLGWAGEYEWYCPLPTSIY